MGLYQPPTPTVRTACAGCSACPPSPYLPCTTTKNSGFCAPSHSRLCPGLPNRSPLPPRCPSPVLVGAQDGIQGHSLLLDGSLREGKGAGSGEQGQSLPQGEVAAPSQCPFPTSQTPPSPGLGTKGPQGPCTHEVGRGGGGIGIVAVCPRPYSAEAKGESPLLGQQGVGCQPLRNLQGLGPSPDTPSPPSPPNKRPLGGALGRSTHPPWANTCPMQPIPPEDSIALVSGHLLISPLEKGQQPRAPPHESKLQQGDGDPHPPDLPLPWGWAGLTCTARGSAGSTTAAHRDPVSMTR